MRNKLIFTFLALIICSFFIRCGSKRNEQGYRFDSQGRIYARPDYPYFYKIPKDWYKRVVFVSNHMGEKKIFFSSRSQSEDLSIARENAKLQAASFAASAIRNMTKIQIRFVNKKLRNGIRVPVQRFIIVRTAKNARVRGLTLVKMKMLRPDNRYFIYSLFGMPYSIFLQARNMALNQLRNKRIVKSTRVSRFKKEFSRLD